MKPENVLLQESGHILLTDFGTILFLNDVVPVTDEKEKKRGRGYTFCGSSSYISPEVLDGKVPSFSSDFWAWGCIIYQLLTGSVLFSEENEHEWFSSLTHSYLIFEKITSFDVDSFAFPPSVPESAQVVTAVSFHA